MPESKELIEYVGEHLVLRDVGDMHFYPDIECLLPKNYLRHEQSIKDFEVYEDDIWVLSYPKCGTTWCQEMVWLVANSLDYKGAEVVVNQRYPFIEFGKLFKEGALNISGSIVSASLVQDTLKIAENMPRPRFIKCHLPLALLPTQLFEKKAKVVFVMRDPRDAAVSFMHHYRVLFGYTGTEDKFYEAFLEGSVLYGSYWHYVAPIWGLRNKPNMLVTTYEDMKKDLPRVVRQTAKFLGKTVKDEDMAGLLDHLSFAKMKTNDATNYMGFTKVLQSFFDKPAVPKGEFMRKGQVGDYKNAMSQEMVEKFQQHHAEMKRKLGLADDKDFPY